MRYRHGLAVAAAISAGALLTACGQPSPTATPPPAATLSPAEQGERLFAVKGCATCHGLAGAGSDIAPALPGHSAEQVLRQVRSPVGSMPAFGAERISDQELDLIAANDVTARRWQRVDSPQAWMRGKGFDTFCPIGPAIVTPDDLPDPDSVTITTSVNGQVVRRGSTSQMVRTVARIISEVSSVITLYPGTLLLTGAPPGMTSEPMAALCPGDEVCVEIDGIGQLVNPVVQG